MKIKVKSIPENFEKEMSGKKPNTIRVLDGSDEIEVINSETGEYFKRTIEDIFIWNGTIIISWKKGENK